MIGKTVFGSGVQEILARQAAEEMARAQAAPFTPYEQPALPGHVQVGPYRYRVSTDAADLLKRVETKNGGSYGYFDPQHLLLVVDGRLPRDQQADTLWHEVKHACAETAGRTVDACDATLTAEAMIEGSTPWELMVLRQNPELVAFLTNDPTAEMERREQEERQRRRHQQVLEQIEALQTELRDAAVINDQVACEEMGELRTRFDGLDEQIQHSNWLAHLRQDHLRALLGTLHDRGLELTTDTALILEVLCSLVVDDASPEAPQVDIPTAPEPTHEFLNGARWEFGRKAEGDDPKTVPATDLDTLAKSLQATQSAEDESSYDVARRQGLLGGGEPW